MKPANPAHTTVFKTHSLGQEEFSHGRTHPKNSAPIIAQASSIPGPNTTNPVTSVRTPRPSAASSCVTTWRRACPRPASSSSPKPLATRDCRFTGIPITCERMLLDQHKQIGSAIILGHRGQRTSRPDSPYMTSRPQREKGMNEPTDTYVWVPLSITAWIRATSCYGTSFPSILIRLRLFPTARRRTASWPKASYTPKSCCSTAVPISAWPPSAGNRQNPAKCRLPGPGHAPSGNGGASLFREQFARFFQ